MKKLTNLHIRKKLLAFLVLVTLIFGFLIFRLCYLQVFVSGNIVGKASGQWNRGLPMMAERGDIVDRNGLVIADTMVKYTLYVRPNALREHEQVATLISKTLDKDYDKIFEKISKKGVSEITVAKKLNKEQMMNIALKNFKGVYFAEESVRYFPYNDSMAQILGFTNVDGKGQFGVEKYYDQYLRGSDGKVLTETDLVGKELEDNVTSYLPAIDGMTAELTIDYYIQSFAEDIIKRAMLEYKAKSANCLVMNSKTGEIVAMAQAPTFDLNNVPRDNVTELFEMAKNSMISNVFEPGSTFKILTSAIGLEENTYDSNHKFYCNGARIVDGQRIKCWQSKGHGSQSFAEGVANSCNCVFMDIATKTGTKTMYSYFEKFGITQKTGVDMVGEAKSIMLREDAVKNVDIARIGFGQAIAVTPIQLLSAVSTCINGGYKVTPHVLKKMKDDRFGEVINRKHGLGERIISQSTSDTLKEMLYGVVERGGGKNASVPGYKIGGKTGTAQKYENGVIARGKYVSSFLGFTSVGNEDYVCLMTVDEPQGYLYYGSIVCAPLVGDLFKNIFAYHNLPPKYTPEELKNLGKTFIMPNLIGMKVSDAIKLLKSRNIMFEYSGEGNKITYQMPASGAIVNNKTVIYFNIV